MKNCSNTVEGKTDTRASSFTPLGLQSTEQRFNIVPQHIRTNRVLKNGTKRLGVFSAQWHDIKV